MSLLESLKKHKAAIGVSAAVNIGSCLFGFDTGVAGGVVALSSFKQEFNLASSAAVYADASSNIIALLNAGAFFGTFIPPILGMRLGRKYLLVIAALFFLLGGILQVAASGPTLALMYAGRVIAGLGVGMISNVSPIFVAEAAPKHLRGIMMALFEMFLVSGGMLAYWTTYGCSVHLAPTSAQWRTPLSLQIVLAVLVMVSALLVPESPRWLAKKDRYDEAAKSLCTLRGATSAHAVEIVQELAEIRAQIEEEISATQGRALRELFERHNFTRLLWALGVGFFAMWCGHNSILYYGPTVFAQIGYATQNAALLASGVFTCIKFGSTIVFLFGGVQIFHRKTLMAGGGFFMGAFLFGLGALLVTHPPSTTAGSESSAGQGMMAFIYLFVVAYSVSWGPLQWIYIGEIFPTRIRDWGMGIGAANIWLWNFVVSKITPISILNIGWKTWMIFGTLNVLGAVYAWLLPETKDLSLEEMDVLFGVVDENTRRGDIEKNLQGAKVDNGGADDVVEQSTK